MNPDRELLVRGGMVVDGTGAPAQRADVLIRGDLIVAVDRDLTAGSHMQVLDAGGLHVAPGFIDTHSHSDLRILADPDLQMKVRQGITLDVLGQDGISVAPVRDEDVVHTQKQLAGLLGDPDVARDWRTVAEYLKVLDRGAGLNVGYLAPHGAVRACAMGLDNRAPDDKELRRMVRLLGQAMDEGALGLSTGLIYPPCCYGSTDELVWLCEEVARRDGVFVVHMRSESDRILTAVDEMIEVARRSRVHVHISHLKIAGRDNWPLAGELLGKLHAAREEGLRVTADQYPYGAGSTMFGAILPPWAHDGGVDKTVTRLGSPEERAKMRAQILDPAPCDWDNFWKWTGPEGIVVSDVPSGRRPELIGKTVAEGARGAEKEPLEFAFDLLERERMGVAMISFSQGDEVVDRFMKEPFVNVCTDGLLGGRPHPRAFGSFPRILGRYVRERGHLALEEAVRKMTSQAADAMHLRGRGRIAIGQAADLVIFEAERVTDQATFEDPMRFPLGIEHVLTAGTQVVNAGEPTGARPGRVVRK
ncbi:MAG TPA: D-aminoacylase [Polyangia bacterium]